MRDWSEERVGFALGIAGGLAFLLGALLALVTGSLDVVTGRLVGGLTAGSDALILLALGTLSLLFASLGYHAWRGRPFSAALLLLLVAVLAVSVSGPGMGALPLIGAMLVGLAGVLYL